MARKTCCMYKCIWNMVFERGWINMSLLRPYWPQTASEFEVRFQIRVGQICQISLKPAYTLWKRPQLKKSYRFSKPTKLPFRYHITRLCDVHTTLNNMHNQSVKIYLTHPVNYRWTIKERQNINETNMRNSQSLFYQ